MSESQIKEKSEETQTELGVASKVVSFPKLVFQGTGTVTPPPGEGTPVQPELTTKE